MADQRNNVASKSGRLATTLSITPIVLSFLNAAVAITIIGLAADSIAWAGGRGSEESNTVYAIVLGDYGYGESTSDTWFTRMHYLPQYYDTQTFSALIAGSVICVIAGLIAGPLSIASRISKAPSRIILLSCIALEAVAFLATIIVLGYAQEVFNKAPVYDGYNDDPYRIQPKYFDPALPSNSSVRDDIIRYYESPKHYNPMNWNCRLQGHVSSSMQNRLFSLCQEGIAARGLFPALVGLQGVVLIAHVWAWFMSRKSGQAETEYQSANADERVRRLQEEQ